MPDPSSGWGPLLTLVAVIVASIYLGTAAQRAIEKGSFLKGYFLGNRNLGVWAIALTATVQSGGTFMGFPALIYTHGWVVALWIAAYMVVPITGFGIMGKRLAGLSRRSGAVTVPDLFRERFDSPAVGVASSLLILFYLSFMMVAQFKAGAILMKLAWPASGAFAITEELAPGGADAAYLIGLVIFTLVVVGYTLIGGFLAAVWTDLLQSLLMLAGVLILLPLTLWKAGGLEHATIAAVRNTGPAFAWAPGYATDGRAFLTIGLAISNWFVFVFSGLGSTTGMVRMMATKDSASIRRSIFVLSVYNCLIYLPLVVICVAARALIPDLKTADEVIPRLALGITRDLPGGSLAAGLILAAPFGAVMATVSCYLLVIASGVTRDIYQRFFKPAATDREMKRVTRFAMIAVGAIAILANLRPVGFLQIIVNFCGMGGGATFVVPALMACYWKRATAAGAIASMIAGSATILTLFGAGMLSDVDPMIGPASRFRPLYLLGLEPAVWGPAASLLAGVAVSLVTKPPDAARVARFFDADPNSKRLIPLKESSS